jgi:hypothetical protein
MVKVTPDRLAVYVCYTDPILVGLDPNSAKRETMGWLIKKIGGSICIENDRTIVTPQTSNGSGEGIFIAISWIQEIRVLEKGEKIQPGSLFNNGLP